MRGAECGGAWIKILLSRYLSPIDNEDRWAGVWSGTEPFNAS